MISYINWIAVYYFSLLFLVKLMIIAKGGQVINTGSNFQESIWFTMNKTK